MTETIVLGLDGANWPLLQPWLEDGDLPNIASLQEDGVWTDMESCLPPVTCPNWRCYSTGKNPGKLGVFWWEKIDTDARTLSTPTSRSFKSANFWDYLNDEGLSAGVFNLPMTYPPFEIDEFMVAGGPDSKDEDYAHPGVLQEQLEEAGYRLHPDPPVTANDDTGAAAGIVDLINDRLSTFRRLVDERDPTVAHCTVFYINVLQHFFWRGEPTREAWQIIDDHIGRLREDHPDATLMLMSDHGCTAVDTVFYANSWLEQEGYLKTTGGSASTLASLGLNKEQLSRVAHRLGVHDLVLRLTPETVKDRLPDSEEGFRRERKLDLVDWDQTVAIASGQGLITVVDDDPEVVDNLIADLRALEDDEGRPIASEVMTREEAYDGPYTVDAPGVIFDQRDGVHTSGAIGDNPVFAGTGQWEAENVRTGLFLADGPAIESTGLPDSISITDVAPTVLHSVGCAVPDAVDGDVLDLFGETEVTYRDPIPFGETGAAAADDVAERLEHLGYLE